MFDIAIFDRTIACNATYPSLSRGDSSFVESRGSSSKKALKYYHDNRWTIWKLFVNYRVFVIPKESQKYKISWNGLNARKDRSLFFFKKSLQLKIVSRIAVSFFETNV